MKLGINYTESNIYLEGVSELRLTPVKNPIPHPYNDIFKMCRKYCELHPPPRTMSIVK